MCAGPVTAHVFSWILVGVPSGMPKNSVASAEGVRGLQAVSVSEAGCAAEPAGPRPKERLATPPAQCASPKYLAIRALVCRKPYGGSDRHHANSPSHHPSLISVTAL
jgi:hypothetical protein